MATTKRITLGIAAGALALGAGLGVTGVATAATTPSPAVTESAPAGGFGRHGGHGGDRGQLAADLATKLGVEEAKVTEALQTFREENKPTTPPAEGTAPAEGTRPDRAAMDAALAKSLAEKLGVDEAKVTAALEEIRSEAQAERAETLKTRLDKAVSDGTLTQAEADAVTKAVEKGVIGGGGR
ncbi:hypothetical protein BIU82_06850 [Arthrobacter sp. SW1]|uniref:hypothetical protein n=1 Tax=Arthrobacter sp. SW1 TaxID=1920889 RepID=UPI000877DD0E|nr:hypothetical protein [Arthrobacter sp. SW1]OFI37814.1 hypothetical protein BIU82_06850 [Arthrobacter sp. SW1]